MMTSDVIFNYDDVLNHISQMMITDMTRENMIALIKGQINSLAEWQYTTYTTEYTMLVKDGTIYGVQGMTASVLNQDSVAEASRQLKDVY